MKLEYLLYTLSVYGAKNQNNQHWVFRGEYL